MDGPSSARENFRVEKVGDELHFHFRDTDGTVPPLLLKVREQFVLDKAHILGGILWDIYPSLKCPSLLDEAIKATQSAVDNHPELSEDANLFFNLGSQLKERHEHAHHPDDLYRARDALQRAVVLTPDGDPEQAGRLFEAGTLQGMCFGLTGRVNDIDDAITALCCAVELWSEGDQNMLSALHNYSEALLDRFHCLGNIDDLEQSIAALRRAIQLMPDSHPYLPTWFNNLGCSLLLRFEGIGRLDDLEQSIVAMLRAVELTPDGHPNLPARIDSLGKAIYTRFQRIWQLGDLEQCITACRRAIELTPDGHPHLPGRINNLGLSLFLRFERIGQLDDLEQSIAALRRAIELTQEGHPSFPKRANNLGYSLFLRFRRVGQLDDLEQSIAALRRAIQLTPDGHPDSSRLLSNLGRSLGSRFERIGKLDDLEQSIAAHRRAIELTPDGHPCLPERIGVSGSSLVLRFERLGQLEDLEQSIAAFCRAIKLTLDGHPSFPAWANNLGCSLLSRFQHVGQLDDLEQSIVAYRLAIEHTTDGHPDLPAYISNLGRSLRSRFGRFGQLDDLEQSIAALHRAVELTPDGHPDLPALIASLGNAINSRFKRTGQLDDLEQSISTFRRAIELTPDDHPDLPTWINNLGGSVHSRFERIGQLADLEESIVAYRRTVKLMPDGHPNVPRWISNLGSSLLSRFKRIGQLDDLEQSIAALRCAIKRTPDGHPDLPQLFNHLGRSLRSRFGRIGQLDDFEQSIAAYRRAIELTPDGHPHLPMWIGNLGCSLWSCFSRSGQLDDFEQSIVALCRAIELTPDGDSGLPGRISNLGNLLLLCFILIGRLEDLEQSITEFQRGVDLTSEDPLARSSLSGDLGVALFFLCVRNPMQSRFDAANAALMDSTEKAIGLPSSRQCYASICFSMHVMYPAFGSKKSLLFAGSRAMATLPEVVWLGYDVNRRFDEAAALAEHVYDAVSAAVETASLKQAVEWLETGRAIIWSQVLSLRTPIDELQKQQPDLARTLGGLQQELQHSARVTSFAGYAEPFGYVPGLSINTEADRHRQLADIYDFTLKQIRECTGFEDFLRPKQLEQLVPSSSLLCGPVIFLNVASTGCHAIILLPGLCLTSLPLPELSSERAVELRRLWVAHVLSHRVRERATALIGEQNPSETYLGHIWNWIVHPVLEALNFVRLGPDDDLPHVTWCPTGPLMQLPLHAAGLYDKPDGPRVYDFVVSSYTPSLSALSRCCEGAAEPCPKPDVLIVSQPATPNHTPLPGTVREAGRLEGILHSWGTTSKWLNDKTATTQEVRSVLGQYHWIHLACHGLQNRQDPTQSAFQLFDGPLTLSDLMGTVAENAEFAFLSACHTAVGDEKTPEESAHLAAGMLAAGYKGVVATMWSIQDADAPVVVDAFYDELLALRNAEVVKRGETGAAYALHKATRILRKEIGEDQFMRWVPFVHFGV